MKPIRVHHLEVKSQTYAQEMRIIRRKENAARKWKKKLSDEFEALLWEGRDPQPGVRKFKYVANHGYNPELKASLRAHRLGLRPGSRACHLALGFLKNMPYRVMETMAYQSPDWKRVWNNVTKFGELEDNEENRAKFLAWIDAGGVVDSRHNCNWDYAWGRTPSWFVRYQLGW
jgi:hypothetical protein